MNRGEIVDLARYYLGEPSASFHPATIVNSLVEQGEIDICKQTRYIRDYSLESTVTDQVEYDWPTAAMYILRIQWQNSSGSWQKLLTTNARMEDPDIVGASVPLWWPDARRRKFWIVPKPAAGTNNLRIWHVRTPAAYAGDSQSPEIPVEQHMLLVYWLAWHGHLSQGEFEKASAMQSLYREGLEGFKRDADQHHTPDRPEQVPTSDDPGWSEYGDV